MASSKDDGRLQFDTRCLEEFEIALAAQLSARLPLVYSIVVINILVLAKAFSGTVSPWHLAIVTIPLIAAACVRAFYWRPKMVAQRTRDQIRDDLKLLPRTGTAMATGLIIFAMSLYPFGDIQQQSLVHYVATLTAFVGILGLNPSPRTAVAMTVISVLPSVGVFLYLGHHNAVSISVTMVTVSALLLLIARSQHSGFMDLVRSKLQLQEREAETAKLNALLHKQAYFDELTGLANRLSFFESFDQESKRSSGEPPWLGLIDLDGFKAINDLFGHRAGDAVLIEVANRLSVIPNLVSCGRLGGDEFVFLLEGTLLQQDAIRRCEELAALIAEPISFGSKFLNIKTSIGIRKTEHLGISECLERADWALYEAKRAGGSIKIFSSKDEELMQEQARIARLFDAADLSSQLRVVYQPIIDYDTSEPHSIEVLARWQAADGTLNMPDLFIPMAENTHRTSELTKVIIKLAIAEMPEAMTNASLHVNLSAKDITNPEFTNWLLQGDAFNTFARDKMILELTETAIMAGGPDAVKNLKKLRAGGFRVALDDFGVGQSSLSRIHQLPLDQIKIDKSFCREGNSDEHGWAIVATILALCRQLSLECVLEGIETEAEAIKARSIGVRLMQGYHFSKPMAAADYPKKREMMPFAVRQISQKTAA